MMDSQKTSGRIVNAAGIACDAQITILDALAMLRFAMRCNDLSEVRRVFQRYFTASFSTRGSKE
jgi:hypothetical protein